MIAVKVARFVAAYRAELAKASNDPGISRFLDALAAIDASEALDRSANGDTAHPALQHLDRAMAQLSGDGDWIAAVRAIVPHLSWGGSYRDSGPGAAVTRKMVWGEVAGRNGLVTSEAIKLGFFLLSPRITYPLHGHSALEIYSVVSGTMTVTLGLDRRMKRSIAALGHSVTPEGEAHALEIGPNPALIVYCWTGDLFSPVWWWERGTDGSWTKVFPTMA